MGQLEGYAVTEDGNIMTYANTGLFCFYQGTHTLWQVMEIFVIIL